VPSHRVQLDFQKKPSYGLSPETARKREGGRTSGRDGNLGENNNELGSLLPSTCADSVLGSKDVSAFVDVAI